MNDQPTPFLNWSAIKKGKRIIVAVVGGTVLALGLALVVLPGPAFLVIPAGLAILAIEFAWARRWLRSARAILPLPSAGTAPGRKLTMETIRRKTRQHQKLKSRRQLPAIASRWSGAMASQRA